MLAALIMSVMSNDLSVGEDGYPADVLNALIEVESCGREDVVRGRFYGILQMSPVYLADIGLKPSNVMTRSGAIAAFMAMQRKYRVRRPGMSELAIPIFHKGGAGTWAKWRRHVSSGMTEQEAIAALNNPGLDRFLHKYNQARSGKADWCGR